MKTEMTTEDLKKLVASLALDTKEIKKMNKETAAAQKETAAQMKETDRKLQEIGIHVDGISKSVGQETEDFFYSSLQKKPYLGEIKFDFIDNNFRRRIGNEEVEIDVFLENGKSVGLVEVKNKVTKKSLKQLEKNIERFHRFHPSFKDYKIYGAIAGKIFPENLQTEALKKGYFVVKQQGDHIEVSSPS